MAYEGLERTFARLPYLTRLYSTLSADEMTLDPIFSVNPDMEEVSNLHLAEATITCEEDGEVISQEITLSDGRIYRAEDASPTRRQDGETVRGEEIAAAAVVEQTFEAGQPEVMMSAPEEMMTPSGEPMSSPEVGGDAGPSGESEASMDVSTDDDKGSGCQQRGDIRALWWGVLSLCLMRSLRRRLLA